MVNIGLKGLAGSLALVLSMSVSNIALANSDGFGSDIPLESAAHQIAPEGTVVNFGDGVDKAAAVSWKNASDWKAALSSAVANKGYKADFSDNTVTISKAEKPAAAARPYSSAPSKEIVQKKPTKSEKRRAPAAKPRAAAEVVQNDVPAQGGGGFTIRPYRSATTAAAAPVGGKDDHLVGKDIVSGKDWKPVQTASGTGTYIVEEGFMLRQTINTWADAAGWKVVWDSEHDYVIEAHAAFIGDFVEASSKLFTAMKDARPAITVTFHKGNKVLVVSNQSSDEVN